MSTPIPAQTLWLGRRPYDEVYELQRTLVEERRYGAAPDTLILCEHDPVITVGRRLAAKDNILDQAFPVVEIERGGDVTYHGPGQLVAYPIVQLGEGERDLHRYLRNLEQAILDVLGELGLVGCRNEGYTGAWVGSSGERKIASIGIAVRRWVTFHGLALNVSTDLAHFGAMRPCGLSATVMTSLSAELGRTVTVAEIAPRLAAALGRALGRDFGELT